MEMRIEVHGDIYEDALMIKTFASAQLLHTAICDALDIIRHRKKHGEDVSEKEEHCLDEIRETLCIDGVF